MQTGQTGAKRVDQGNEEPVHTGKNQGPNSGNTLSGKKKTKDGMASKKGVKTLEKRSGYEKKLLWRPPQMTYQGP